MNKFDTIWNYIVKNGTKEPENNSFSKDAIRLELVKNCYCIAMTVEAATRRRIIFAFKKGRDGEPDINTLAVNETSEETGTKMFQKFYKLLNLKSHSLKILAK